MFTLSTNFKNIKLEDWISQTEAARIRGVTRQAIANLIKRGRLKTLEIGGHHLVNKKELLEFQKSIAGRPRKK